MEIKTYKPITPGLRNKIVIRETEISKEGPLKGLVVGKNNVSGRNHHGRITMRHIGGAHKRRIRIVDYKRINSQYSTARVIKIEYDPNRSANLALCKSNDKLFYIIAPLGIKINDPIYNIHHKVQLLQLGQVLPLHKFPIGAMVHNIELTPNTYGKLVRAAGVSGEIVIHKEDQTTIIRLPSKKMITISSNCKATFGIVGNRYHYLQRLGSAGSARNSGIRPTVRGVAMNPIDHPHGGKTPIVGGRRSAMKTKWGKLAKWVPTV